MTKAGGELFLAGHRLHFSWSPGLVRCAVFIAMSLISGECLIEENLCSFDVNFGPKS